MPDEAPVIRATLPAKASDLISVPPRSNTASFYQHTTARATACADHLYRVGDEPAILHHLPELLQNVRTNEDRIASHRDTHLLSVAITARTQGSGHGQSWRCYAWPGPPRPARTSSTTFPAYLALEPVAADSPERLVALLIGVDLGPLITDWASLATLLWRERCTSADVTESAWRFAARGLLLVPLLLACTATPPPRLPPPRASADCPARQRRSSSEASQPLTDGVGSLLGRARLVDSLQAVGTLELRRRR